MLSYLILFIYRAGLAMNILTVYDIQNKFIGNYVSFVTFIHELVSLNLCFVFQNLNTFLHFFAAKI